MRRRRTLQPKPQALRTTGPAGRAEGPGGRAARLAARGVAMAGTTRIENASWVVAWDGGAGEHVYLTDADVVFTGDRITWVGRSYDGAADTIVDGRNLMAMPGLVDIHS